MHSELATRLRLVCEFWATNSHISCKPVAIQKICEIGSKNQWKFACYSQFFVAN